MSNCQSPDSVDTLPLRSRGCVFYDLVITRRWTGTCTALQHATRAGATVNPWKFFNGNCRGRASWSERHPLVAVVPEWTKKTKQSTECWFFRRETRSIMEREESQERATGAAKAYLDLHAQQDLDSRQRLRPRHQALQGGRTEATGARCQPF